MFIIWTRVFYRELKHSSNQYHHYIREPSIVFFICNTRGENKSNTYLYLMIQVSVSNRVFTEPTELIHIYFGLTDGVAFKPFFYILGNKYFVSIYTMYLPLSHLVVLDFVCPDGSIDPLFQSLACIFIVHA